MKPFFGFSKNMYQNATKKYVSKKIFLRPLRYIKTVEKKLGRKNFLDPPLRENMGQKRKNAKNGQF